MTNDGRVRLRAGQTYPIFFRLQSLQDDDGAFSADAQARLRTEGGQLGLDRAIARHAGVGGIDLSQWGEHEYNVATQPDTIAALKRLQAMSPTELSFFRLRTTDALMARLFTWEILTELVNGTPSQHVLTALRQQEDRLVGGIVQMAPAGYVCYPLLARPQPLAAVFLTAYGSQIVVMPKRGMFVRPVEFTTWPVGLARIRFAGTGAGVYATSVRAFPERHAESLLRFLLKRGDLSIHRLTTPERFRTENGELDVDAHWVLWSSIRFGMDSTTSLAVEWNQASSTWTAFRALSTLQGIWQGARQKAPPLSSVIDPRHVRTYAVSTFPEGPERDWATGVVDNFQRELEDRYQPKTLDEALRDIGDIRNLVHGVYATGDLTRRLKVLRRVEKHQPNLQLINDMAAFWWASVLIETDKNAEPGCAPWERSI